MKHRPLLSALVAAVLPLTVASVAYAGIDPSDAAASELSVAQADPTGDVHLERHAARGVSTRVRGSIDMDRVDYRIDRQGQTLTITYSMARVLRPATRYHQLVATVIATGKRMQGSTAVLITPVRAPDRVRVLVFDPRSDESDHLCRPATVEVSRAQDTVTQAVPFSCFSDVLDHGHLRSATLVEKPRGADVAWDYTTRTRDLPLSPAPVASGAQPPVS